MSRRYLFVCALLGSGCSDPNDDVPCTEQLNGVCVGIENEAGGQAGPCPCSRPLIEVRGQAELDAALRGAPSCILLAEGQYGVVELHDGFELVGASVQGVALQWLNFLDGAASACRLTTTGTYLAEGASSTMQYLNIGPSPVDGVLVSAGADARIVGSTITSTKRYGVSA